MSTEIKKPSRQVRCQKRLKSRGLCSQCGSPRHNESEALCDPCLGKLREANRERHGFQPWQPGGKGRPPYSARRTPSQAPKTPRAAVCTASGPGRECDHSRQCP